MYYNDRGTTNASGVGIGHKSVASRLLRLSKDLVTSIGNADVGPGVQFGVESQGMLANRKLLQHVRQLSTDIGADIIVHHPDGSTPGTTDFLPKLLLTLQRSAYLGSNWVVIHPPSGRSPQASALVEKELTSHKLVREVEGSGVHLAIENLGPRKTLPILGSLGELTEVVERCRGKYETEGMIGMCLDYGHLTSFEAKRGRGVEEVLEAAQGLPDLVKVMHIHINDGSGDQHLLIGERPVGHSHAVLDMYERVLLEEVIPAVRSCRTYVLERNSSYSFAQLQRSASLLVESIRHRRRFNVT